MYLSMLSLVLRPVFSRSVSIRTGLFRLLLSMLLLTGQGHADPVEFTVATDGDDVSAAQLRGKIVYIDFWASWCAPCRKSFPWMNAMHQKYASQGLHILAVNLDKGRELSDDFLKAMPAEFQIAYDPEALLAQQFDLRGMPSAFVLDRNGELATTHVGFREGLKESYEQKLIELLGR